jgi:hypothetical protein
MVPGIDVTTFLFMMVILKIPIAMLLYIVWWAIRAVPEPEEGSRDDGGTKRPPRHPRPPRPRRPRRGPHAEPPPSTPARMRTTLARGRRVEH